MPSTFNDGASWIASFRAVNGVGRKPRRVRIPVSRLRRGHEQADAMRYAEECDHYCRLIEDAARPRDIRHALHLKAITDEQAEALLSGAAIPSHRNEPHEWTVRQAAAAHPSSHRDAEADSVKALKYLDWVDEFCEFAGVRYISEVRLQDVMRWIAAMKKDKRSADARRHRMLYLKRACRMAATVGLPDVLSGLRIDRRDEDAPEVDAYTLEEVGRALRGAVDDRRAQMAIALGAFVGLRPSEIIRARCGDLDGDVMAIGKVRRKNRASRRSLPLPPTLVSWWTELAEGRASEAPLIEARSNHPSRHQTQRMKHAGGRAFSDVSFAQWLAPVLERTTGRRLPPKHLRKTFATWAPRRGLSGRDVERYLGHQSAFLAAVTSERYLGAVAAEELRPAAALIERAVREALAVPQSGTVSKGQARSHAMVLQRRKSSRSKVAQ